MGTENYFQMENRQNNENIQSTKKQKKDPAMKLVVQDRVVSRSISAQFTIRQLYKIKLVRAFDEVSVFNHSSN